MTTDASGYYSFDGISEGQHYISISKPSTDYGFSKIWNGAIDDTGALLYPDVDSVLNPETGRTDCFNVEDNEDDDVSFGLQLDVPPGIELSTSPLMSPSPPTKMPSKTRMNAPSTANAVITSSDPMMYPTPERKSPPIPATLIYVTTSLPPTTKAPSPESPSKFPIITTMAPSSKSPSITPVTSVPISGPNLVTSPP